MSCHNSRYFGLRISGNYLSLWAPEKLVRKKCAIINNSAADRRILLKFGLLMYGMWSTEAAEWTKSTSCRIQDGVRRPKMYLVKLNRY